MSVATPTPSRRRRNLQILAGAAAVLLVLGLIAALVVALSRPAPSTSAAAPAPAATATPTPEPTASPTAIEQARQHQEYRAYVSTVVQGGVAVVSGILGLAGCRDSREVCTARLSEASSQVSGMQEDLAATPAPDCLSAADQRLQDALGFQQKGLDTAREGVEAQNRVQLAQGLLLTTVGLWRAGQAIVAGRQSDC